MMGLSTGRRIFRDYHGGRTACFERCGWFGPIFDHVGQPQQNESQRLESKSLKPHDLRALDDNPLPLASNDPLFGLLNGIVLAAEARRKRDTAPATNSVQFLLSSRTVEFGAASTDDSSVALLP